MKTFDIYDNSLIKIFLEESYDMVQNHFEFDKSLIEELDKVVNLLNTKIKRKIKFNRTELIRLAIKLYLEVYNHMQISSLTNK